MWKYVIPPFVAGLSVLLLTPLVRKWASRLGVVDRPGERKIHQVNTPRAGGLAIFAGFHLAFLAFYFFGWEAFATKFTFEWWRGFLLASGLLLAVGLIDDARGLKPWLKLAGQTCAAFVMYAAGVRFGDLVAWDISPGLDLALTVFWFLAITNAFNLVDGLDGLATGLALISAMGLMGALIFRRMSVDSVVILSLAATCLAFLRYNFHPASIFLGDTGSMFLGFTLATFALQTSSKGTFALTMGAALLAMGIPVFDTLLAVWRRSVRMLAPKHLRDARGSAGLMTADREHLHHRLLTSMTQRQVAGLLFAINAAFVVVALLTVVFKAHALGIYLLAFVAGIYVIIRHLAHVELWDTGAVLVHGLHRPRGRVVVFILYPLLDLVALTGIFGCTLWVLQLDNSGAKFVDDLLLGWPIWVAPVFLAMVLAKTYRRVWSRARLLDQLALSLSIVTGTLVALGLHHLKAGAGFREGVVIALVYGGSSHFVLTGMRSFVRSLRDLMSFLSLSHSRRRDYNNIPVLLYGAGPKLALYLREKSLGEIDPDRKKFIVGVLADDPNLRSRLLNGYNVFGGLDVSSEVIRREGIKEIVVLEDLAPQVLQELRSVCQEYGVALSEWVYEERVLLSPVPKT